MGQNHLDGLQNGNGNIQKGLLRNGLNPGGLIQRMVSGAGMHLTNIIALGIGTTIHGISGIASGKMLCHQCRLYRRPH